MTADAMYGGERMSRETEIRAQMERLGTYDSAFDQAIKDLCILERERSAARKEWKATAVPGKRPSFDHPLYSVIRALGKDIDKQRDALGLVPKGLDSLRRRAAPPSESAPPPSSGNTAFGELLTAMRDKANGCTP